MIAVTFLTIFVVAFVTFTVFAFTFMLFAFAFMFLATFMFLAIFVFAFFAAVRFWHVGFHLMHFLCHSDDFFSLIFIEIFPVGNSFNYFIHESYHLRAHFRFLTVMVAFMMMFVALLFLVLAVFLTSFFVFLFFAA